MELVKDNPTVLRINNVGGDLRKIELLLSYINKNKDFEIKLLKDKIYRFGKNKYLEQRLLELNKERKGSLLFKDDLGYYTYTGLSSLLENSFGVKVVDKIAYPPYKLLPWYKKDTRSPYGYQVEAIKKLLDVKHGGVEIVTGAGKSLILLHLVKQIGLKTVIVTPSKSIANQLLKDFKNCLGPKYVGQYYDSKKEPKKLIIIAIADSLELIKKDSLDYKLINSSQVVVSDESHRDSALGFSKVFLGVLADAPYRFFFSGTQLRQDGLQLLLDSITGDIVFKMSLKEGVDQGYLAKPLFKILTLDSGSNFTSKDVNSMTRQHFYYNKELNKKAADVINLFCSKNKQVLVLIKEINQFNYLLPHLNYKVGFAHASNEKDNTKIPKEYQASDNTKLVDEFNMGKLPILIGTSCISTGTNILNNELTVYLVGGKSEIAVRQGAIGRSTRLRPEINKKECTILDFDIRNIPVLHNHALTRREIYEQEYGGIKEIGE